MSEDVFNSSGVAARLRESLQDALARHDRPSAVRMALHAVRSAAIDVPSLYTDVLGPLMVEMGDSWLRGNTRVWEEHFASATVRTIVESLFLDVQDAAEKTTRTGQVALLACPREEAHDLGLRMLADRLTLAGWDAHHLGADTPTDEIAAAARALGAQVVLLSAATHYNRVLLDAVVEELTVALPGVRVGAGGPSFECRLDNRYAVSEQDLGLVGATRDRPGS